jgi:dTDP-4-dehydrorhamnose reductase
MKILITGSNGLLGQKLIDLFLQSNQIGNTLIATARGANRHPSKLGYTYVDLNITDREAVFNTVGLYKPDVLIHTAAMTNVDQCEQQPEACQQINVVAVSHIASACHKFQVHLVHISTDFIFDGKAGPYQETDVPNPISIYGKSKLDAEYAVSHSGCSHAILRTVLVYGVSHEMSRSNIVLWVRNELSAGNQIRVVHDQVRTPTLAEDLALACWLSAEQRAQGIYHISGSEQIAIIDLVRMVAEMYGLKKSLIIPVSSAELSQPAKRPPITGFIIQKAREILGYEPTPLQKGIQLVAKQLEERER